MTQVDQLDVLTQSCKNALEEVIKNELNTDDYSCEMKAGSEKGDNYVGVVFRVVAQNSNNKTKENFKVIVKLPPLSAARREQFNVREFFIRESMMYEEVIPLYKRFQESKGIVPTEDGFHESPKCYRAITTDMEEALLLEDLTVCGFEMFDRHKEASFEHVKLVMQLLGKFHALSFAMKDQKPELIEPYTKMHDIFTMKEDDKPFNNWAYAMIGRAYTTLDETTDKVLIEKLKKMFSKEFVFVLKDAVSSEAAGRCAVINHGDCWNNNILFKNKNGVPVDARLIDFQISRFASPVCDIMYYMFNCTTKKIRDAHYDEFLQIYYKSLADFLRRLGSDPDKLFTFSDLQGQLKQFGKFGVLMAMLILPMLIAQGEDVPDLDKVSQQLQNGEDINEIHKSFAPKNTTEDLYKEKMSDILRDADRLGYLD